MKITLVKDGYRLVTGPNGNVSVQCMADKGSLYSLDAAALFGIIKVEAGK